MDRRRGDLLVPGPVSDRPQRRESWGIEFPHGPIDVPGLQKRPSLRAPAHHFHPRRSGRSPCTEPESGVVNPIERDNGSLPDHLADGAGPTYIPSIPLIARSRSLDSLRPASTRALPHTVPVQPPRVPIRNASTKSASVRGQTQPGLPPRSSDRRPPVARTQGIPRDPAWREWWQRYSYCSVKPTMSKPTGMADSWLQRGIFRSRRSASASSQGA